MRSSAIFLRDVLSGNPLRFWYDSKFEVEPNNDKFSVRAQNFDTIPAWDFNGHCLYELESLAGLIPIRLLSMLIFPDKYMKMKKKH